VPLPWLLVGVPAVAAVGWAIPLLGISLAAFIAVDVLTGLARRIRTSTRTFATATTEEN
jgi:hypothetical protein